MLETFAEICDCRLSRFDFDSRKTVERFVVVADHLGFTAVITERNKKKSFHISITIIHVSTV